MTKIPAVAKIPAADGKRLHAFTALPSSRTTILGPRRMPAVKAPIGNSDSYIQIFTSNGFQPLTNAGYLTAIQTLKPDIAIALADMNYGAVATSQSKGVRRMCERTEDWMAELHSTLQLEELRSSNTSIFAATLPAPHTIQWEYLNRLSGDLFEKLSGLAVYDVDILPDLTNYPNLESLPRLSLDTPSGPHEILRQVSLGIDTFLLPFVNAISDAGVAMSFTFPPPSGSANNVTGNGIDLLPLGIDMTGSENITALAPLVDNCTCYACTSHHRAYLHHLLNAREMLAWTLLQIHNHHIIEQFFAGIRKSLECGVEQYEDDCRRFGRVYEASLPVGVGTRPRSRGYHFKSEHGEPKRNKVTWQILQEEQGESEKAKIVEARLARDQIDTPVIPDTDAQTEELVREGISKLDTKELDA